jgi:hypothetical protein
VTSSRATRGGRTPHRGDPFVYLRSLRFQDSMPSYSSSTDLAPP